MARGHPFFYDRKDLAILTYKRPVIYVIFPESVTKEQKKSKWYIVKGI